MDKKSTEIKRRQDAGLGTRQQLSKATVQNLTDERYSASMVQRDMRKGLAAVQTQTPTRMLW